VTRSDRRQRHAQIHLPPLSAIEALTIVTILERAVAAIWRAHGDDMEQLRSARELEARARRRRFTCHNPDVDPNIDF